MNDIILVLSNPEKSNIPDNININYILDNNIKKDKIAKAIKESDKRINDINNIISDIVIPEFKNKNITIPKEPSFMNRNKNDTIKSKKFQQYLKEKEENELNELNKKFKAKEVPLSSKIVNPPQINITKKNIDNLEVKYKDNNTLYDKYISSYINNKNKESVIVNENNNFKSKDIPAFYNNLISLKEYENNIKEKKILEKQKHITKLLNSVSVPKTIKTMELYKEKNIEKQNKIEEEAYKECKFKPEIKKLTENIIEKMKPKEQIINKTVGKFKNLLKKPQTNNEIKLNFEEENIETGDQKINMSHKVVSNNNNTINNAILKLVDHKKTKKQTQQEELLKIKKDNEEKQKEEHKKLQKIQQEEKKKKEKEFRDKMGLTIIAAKDKPSNNVSSKFSEKNTTNNNFIKEFKDKIENNIKNKIALHQELNYTSKNLAYYFNKL